MELQRFKRGNLVKDKETGKEAVIQYSYAEKYGGDKFNDYSIIFLEDGNSSAWYGDGDLIFIDKGGDDILKVAKEKREEIRKRNTDIKYILSKLEDSLSSESILFLFDLIGFDSQFKKKGEFYILFSEWSNMYKLFIHIKDSKTLEDAESVLTEEGKKELNIKRVWEEFNKYKS